MPSCIHTAFAPIRIAASTIGGTRSGRRKILTISTGSGIDSRSGYAFSPRTSVSVGLTGMMRYPDRCMYSDTPKLGRIRLLDRPTTAMVFAARKISLAVVIHLHFKQLSEAVDFFGGQVAEFPALQSAEFEKADLHPLEFFYEPAEILEHDADLILAALVDLYLVPRVVG